MVELLALIRICGRSLLRHRRKEANKIVENY